MEKEIKKSNRKIRSQTQIGAPVYDDLNERFSTSVYVIRVKKELVATFFSKSASESRIMALQFMDNNK
jgi:hypothetical protein